MRENIYGGKLIAIDGPNGAGKTTIIKALEERLKKYAYDVYATQEPTDTDLGRFIREYAEKNKGIGLACMVAADRYEHIKNEIIPNLKKRKIVITDRYVLSSLILQRMDGIDEAFILSINNEIIKPDLQVSVIADEKILQQRMAERGNLTRFEKNNQSENELRHLGYGITLLKKLDVNVFCFNNNANNFENKVEELANIITCLAND